jgi:hypothetical protein
MVNALAKLHNFCIDENDISMLEQSADDSFRIANNELGFVALEEANNCDDVPIPVQILDGGNHFEDIPQPERRRDDRRGEQQDGVLLPRERLLQHVVGAHLARPSTNLYK